MLFLTQKAAVNEIIAIKNNTLALLLYDVSLWMKRTSLINCSILQCYTLNTKQSSGTESFLESQYIICCSKTSLSI